MNEEILIKEINQIGVVVSDLQESMKRYWKLFGIGPWNVHTFAPPYLSGTTLRGKPAKYTIKVAFTRIGSLELELIQPLEGKNIYTEFYAEKGEGLHHIAYSIKNDIEEAIEEFKDQGISVLQSGTWYGGFFAYMDTEKILGFSIELLKRTGKRPPPEETYP